MRLLVVSVMGVCLLTSCVEDTSPPGARDAPPPDGATADSGPKDAATGAPPDAGKPDATVADGGRDDGGATADAAPNDAAVEASVDAGACPFAAGDTVDATLKMTADDHFALYVNGALVDDTVRTWSSPQTYAIKLLRSPLRVNVLAIAGINTQKIDGYDRGVIVDLAYSVDGVAHALLSDATFKVATTLETNWFDVAFADVGWAPAIDQGPHGMGPWGAVLGTSSARWIWSVDSNQTAAQKAAEETVYVRRSFYLDMTGAPVGVAPACP